jgi:hypothetical protein
VASQLTATATGDATKSAQQAAAASVAEHINKGPGQSADMISVKLKIVGDPQFIKQDEIFVSPQARLYRDIDTGESATDKSRFIGTDDGSIVLDDGEVHVRLNWKTPVDIDEYTGGLRHDSKYQTSAFSGLYKVTTVESNFSGGKFEQNLELIRLQDQPEDGKAVNPASIPFAPTDPVQTIEQTNASVLSAITKNNSPGGADANSPAPTEQQQQDEQKNEQQDPQAGNYKDVVQNGSTETAGDPGAGEGVPAGPPPRKASVYQSTYDNAIANGVPPFAAAQQASQASREADAAAAAATFG